MRALHRATIFLVNPLVWNRAGFEHRRNADVLRLFMIYRNNDNALDGSSGMVGSKKLTSRVSSDRFTHKRVPFTSAIFDPTDMIPITTYGNKSREYFIYLR